MADKPAETPKAKANSQVEALKKNHFWILAGILAITGLVVWWMGTGALAVQFQKDRSINDGAFSMVQPYKDRPVPNQHYKDAVNKENETLSVSVVSTWDKLYDRQAEILTMHKDVGKELKDLILLDVKERAERESKESQNILRALQDFRNGQIIEQEFAALFEMLNLRRVRTKTAPAAGGAAGAAVPGAGVEVPAAEADGPVNEGVVVWAAPYTTDKLMARYKTVQPPSVNRVAVTQEDIWIFKSLFGVIQKINTYSNENWLDVMNGKPLPPAPPRIDQGNVVIKRIDYCDVAQYAMGRAFGDPGRIRPVGQENRDDAIFSAGGSGSTFSVGTQGTPEEDKLLLENRYLDSKNYPVTDPADPPIAEFRQVFVQLQVLMDQRLVPVLIAECAQAKFPIETRQVRMFLDGVDVIRVEDAGRDLLSKVEQSPHDVAVTLRGVVYIYLKPDKNKLGKGSDKEPGKRDYGIPRQKESAEAAL